MAKRTSIEMPTSLLFSGGAEDPLAQLGSYCALSRSETSDKSTDSASGQDLNELLSVAEFLFGHKTLSSALAIVDSRRSLITKITAPSGRFLHAIRSSSSATAIASASAVNEACLQHTNNTMQTIPATLRERSATRKGDEQYYLCLLSSPPQSSQHKHKLPLRYCSCRSFLEKSTKRASSLSSARIASGAGFRNGYHHHNNDENYQDGPPVCKHLLALFLLPHLTSGDSSTSQGYGNNSYNNCCQEIRSVSEEDFASLILNRVL
mmetsp:Transcript_3463/g.9697  ORF Transcript_3463/g.9697 Transcript_3463/m.9697 type:complete len:264 (+) Transcript_3463:421-1212(+)